jgi:hypothetical protein
MPKQHVMDHTGHSTYAFHRGDIVAVEEAERRFKELTGKGFTAGFRTDPGEFKKVTAFNPDAEETIFMPPLRGG